MHRRTMTAAALAATALALPAAAGAHVTLQPDQAPAGGFARLDVRVPNERDDKGTREVELRMPPGFASVSYEPEPGWSVRSATRKAAEPIENHGETVDEEVDTVTFTARGDGAVIAPGEFRDFGLSLRLPEGRPGRRLTFKALQTYEGGEVVRWIGAPDADEPAPQVTLTTPPAEQLGEATPEIAENGGEKDEGDGLAIAALVVGGLGLLAGGAALLASRRTRSAEGPLP